MSHAPQGDGSAQGPATSIEKNNSLANVSDVSYDTTKDTLEIKGANNILQVGKELYIWIKNVSGGTLNDGDVVRITGYDSVLDAYEVVKAIADKIINTEVSGVITHQILNNEAGLITVFGRINDLNTIGFTEGEEIYLSPTVAGEYTNVRPTSTPIQIGHIGKVDALVGFIHVEIRELGPSIRGTFSDDADQTYTANVSKAINFNKNDEVEGITHSETVDSEEITIISDGVYNISVEPQYTRTTGGGVDVLNMYIQKSTDGGTTFVNLVDSNIKVSISSSGQEAVTSLTEQPKLLAGDIIRVMVQVEDSDLKLDAFPAFGAGVNAVPVTPSVICNIHWIGP